MVKDLVISSGFFQDRGCVGHGASRYLLIYVDDTNLSGNRHEIVHNFVAYLNNEFPIKDLSLLIYFLELEVLYDDGKLIS